jgi:hypothetical protein
LKINEEAEMGETSTVAEVRNSYNILVGDQLGTLDRRPTRTVGVKVWSGFRWPGIG